jgi:xanthine dehydrogenase YagS FAD-binding subunit
VTLPAAWPGWAGTYLKARERTAGDFPVVSVAVGYSIERGLIRQARLVLGGVAPVPWRSPAAESALEGQRPSAELAMKAATAALATAQPLAHNAFKVEIGHALVERAIMAAAGLQRGE